MRQYSGLVTVCIFGFLMAGCATLFAGEEAKPDVVSNKPLSSSYQAEPDAEISNELDKYRGILNRDYGVVLAVAEDTLQFGKPESSLGNLVADALRFRAAREKRAYVHIGVIDEGSFKLFFEPGEITRGDVLEFMPYHNQLVILTLSGSQVIELANEIASMGGGPVSGLRFRIDGNRAAAILTNAEVLQPKREYLVATSSYLANGGGPYSSLWSAQKAEVMDVTIRDLYSDFLRERRTIYSETDGRIRP